VIVADIVDGDPGRQVYVTLPFDIPDFRTQCFLCENRVLRANSSRDRGIAPLQQLLVRTHIAISFEICSAARIGPAMLAGTGANCHPHTTWRTAT
jgi:hypothetical protein